MLLDLGSGSKGFCYQTSTVFQFIGYIVMILKILIPVALIIVGVISLGKAVIASDDKEIKTAVNSLIKKFIAAVLIFFIPNIVSALFSIVNGFSEVEADYNTCVRCITGPTKSQCKSAVSGSSN